MKTKTLLFSILFNAAMIGGVFSQHTHADWAKHIVAPENTSFSSIISDGEALIANGYWTLEAEYDGIELPYHIGTNALILKKKFDGEILWHTTMTGDGYHIFYNIALDSEKNIIAVGWSTANEYIEINGETIYEPDMEWTGRGIVAKFSGEDGSLIWHKIINPNEEYHNVTLNRVAADDDDNIFITGNANNGFEIEGVEFPYSQEGWGTLTFIAKLNPDGSIIWGEQFHFVEEGAAGWSIPRAVRVMREDVFIAFEYSKPVNVGDSILPFEGNGDFDWISLVKLSTDDGQVIKTIAFGSESEQGLASLDFDNNGNILIAGYFPSESNFRIDGESPRSYGVEDGYAAKLNDDFELIWLRSMGSEFSSRCFNLSVTDDNRIFIGGGFDSYTPLYFEGHHIFDGESPTNSLAMFQMVLSEDGEFEKAFALHGVGIYSIVEYKDAVVLDNDIVMSVGQSIDSVNFVEDDEFFSDHWAGFFIKWNLSKTFHKIFFEIEDGEGNSLDNAVVILESTSNPFNNHSFYQIDQGVYEYTVTLEGYFPVEGQVVVTDKDVVVPITMLATNTGIDSVATPTVNVFPNPARTFFSIVSDQVIEEIVVYNILGKEVYSRTVKETSAIIGAENFSDGIHLVHVKTANGFSIQKVQIIR